MHKRKQNYWSTVENNAGRNCRVNRAQAFRLELKEACESFTCESGVCSHGSKFTASKSQATATQAVSPRYCSYGSGFFSSFPSRLGDKTLSLPVTYRAQCLFRTPRGSPISRKQR